MHAQASATNEALPYRLSNAEKPYKHFQQLQRGGARGAAVSLQAAQPHQDGSRKVAPGAKLAFSTAYAEQVSSTFCKGMSSRHLACLIVFQTG